MRRLDPTAIQTSSADPGDVQVSLMKEKRTASNVHHAMLNQSPDMHLKS